MRHKRHVRALYEQVRQVLRPGGRFLVCDHHTGAGGMSNTELYMSVEEQHEALVQAGYADIVELRRQGGMVLNRGSSV